jgi:hypothetical protein
LIEELPYHIENLEARQDLEYFLMVIFFGDPNTVLAMTPNLKHALNNLKICREYRFESGL